MAKIAETCSRIVYLCWTVIGYEMEIVVLGRTKINELETRKRRLF
jgi:hypothetical protein